MSASLPEKDAAWVYVVHEMEVSFGALTGRFFCGQTNRLITNLDGHALNGSFENPVTSQPFPSLQFSKRPSSAAPNLLLTSGYGMVLESENSGFQ